MAAASSSVASILMPAMALLPSHRMPAGVLLFLNAPSSPSTTRSLHLKSGRTGIFGLFPLRNRVGRSKYPQWVVLAAQSDESEDSVEELEAFLAGKKSKKRASSPEPAIYDDLPRPKKKPVEEMSGLEKLADAWLAEKGGLYWLNQLAWYSCLGLAFAWVVFRFVLPGLGLYELDAPLLPPTEAL